MKPPRISVLLIVLLLLSSSAFAMWGRGPTGKVIAPPTPPPPPPSGGVPAPATAAGFTTAALNADFSQPSYANLANWLYGCGGSLPGWSWPGPCARVDQEFDASAGKNVLHLQHSTSDGGNGHSWAFSYPAVYFGPGSTNNNFPAEGYFQMTFRMSAASLVQPNGTSPVLGGQLAVGTGNANWIEPDTLEVSANSTQYGNGSLEFCNGSICNGIFSWPGGFPTGDMTVYHTIGILWTSDGTSDYWKCAFLDGNFTGCAGWNVTNPSTLSNHQFVIANGPGNAGTNNVDWYLQSMQMWVCPGSYGTTVQCPGNATNGSAITHWPWP